MISHVLHGSLLKKRLEILNVFIHFKNMVENQLSPKMKILTTYGFFLGGGGWGWFPQYFSSMALFTTYLAPTHLNKKVFLKKESIDIWSKVGYL